MEYRPVLTGAVLTKGKRVIYLNFKSVNEGKAARKAVADNSFNKLFNKGKKMSIVGHNSSFIKF